MPPDPMHTDLRFYLERLRAEALRLGAEAHALLTDLDAAFAPGQPLYPLAVQVHPQAAHETLQALAMRADVLSSPIEAGMVVTTGHLAGLFRICAQQYSTQIRNGAYEAGRRRRQEEEAAQKAALQQQQQEAADKAEADRIRRLLQTHAEGE